MMKTALAQDYNLDTATENGMPAYSTTQNPLLDMNFALSSMRISDEEKIREMYQKAYNFDDKYTYLWTFMAGDIRGGAGERRAFTVCLKELAKYNPELLKNSLRMIPEFSRWDLLTNIATDNDITQDIRECALSIIEEQLKKDIKGSESGKPISLLAKWMPSTNTSSKATRAKASVIRKYLNMTDSQYRKTMANLRRYLDVLEVKMTANEWKEIDYEKVPSRANLLYSNAFMRHDKERRENYLEEVQIGTKKVNTGVLYPYEIEFRMEQVLSTRDKQKIDELDTIWENLPDLEAPEGKDLKVLTVLDSSGSMTWKYYELPCAPINIARSLTLYFSERLKGEYQNSFIEFSDESRFVTLKGEKLSEKIKELYQFSDCSNTNIEGVFQRILDIAVKNNLKQEDLPNSILIISDMEFDSAVDTPDYELDAKETYTNVFNKMTKEYEEHNLKLPRLIFWNVCSRTGAIPVQQNDLGVIYISGFSPQILKMVMTDDIDPYKALKGLLNSDRYKPLLDIYNRVTNR